MKRFLLHSGGHKGSAAIGLLLLRVGFGAMMLLGHGIPKITGFAQKKDKFPVPGWFDSFLTSQTSLLLAIFAEVICAALLMLGLLTRPAAIILSITMITAAFSIHAGDSLFGGKEMAVLYLIPFLTILISGSGNHSLDKALKG